MKIKTKILFFFLIFCFTIFQTKSEYIPEKIEEAIPKNFFFDRFEDSSDKILEYKVFCNFKSSTTNVSFQIFFISALYAKIYMYDNFNSIRQKDGYFADYNFTKNVNNPSNISFNNLICNKDYYFIISILNPNYNFKYYQVLILSDETNAINLNPSLSDYYYIVPRKNGENLIYKFNKDKVVNIEFIGNKAIKENNIIIYDETKGKNSGKSNFEFKKDQEYTIYLYPNKYYSSFTIFFKIFFINSSQSQILKYDFDKKPLIIKRDFPTLFYEMDISNYNIGEYIVFQNYESFNLKYQYKSDFKKNNFIVLGEYDSSNFITIKKTKIDSSILLNISPSSSEISILSLYKLKMTEITDNYEINSKGPKFFYIDYYQFNKMYSFAIESNQNFYFYEQKSDTYDIRISRSYNNITLIKQSKKEPYTLKKGFIVLNSNEDIYLKVQKFNYSIFDEWADQKLSYQRYYYEYFQICQGESTPQELYFYIDKHDYFKSIFGNYSAYFIKEKDINILSDFDFNKINETNLFHFSNENGFLKIKCRNPAMFKHSYFNLDKYDSRISEDFTSGKRYIINKLDMKYKYYFTEKLVDKTIPLKISLLGVSEESSILFNLDNKNYTLNNSISLEINYKYDEGNEGIISFVANSPIEDTMLIEIIVGFIKEDLDSFEIVDFIHSLGNRTLKDEKGIIIKIPKDLNEDLFDFSIKLPSYNIYNKVYYDFQIIYDKIEFIVPIFDCRKQVENFLIPLFKRNPYLYLSEKDKESNDKFFYILIYNYHYNDMNYSIKKPKLFSATELNTIYKLPKLKEEEEKYYYKIFFPEGNYSSLLARVIGDDLKSYLSLNSIQYEFSDIDDNYFNIPINKNDIMNNNSFLNYYGSSSSDSYIIFNPKEEVKYIPKYKYSTVKYFNFFKKVNQINEKNEIEVILNSYAYYIGQIPCKYYILINKFNWVLPSSRELIEINDIFSIIYDYENGNLNKSKNIPYMILEPKLLYAKKRGFSISS